MMMMRLQVISTSGRMWVESRMVCWRPEVFDQLAHLADLVGIKAARRLVENEQIGFMHERIGQADALPVAFGKCADQFFLDVFQSAKLLHVARRAH